MNLKGFYRIYFIAFSVLFLSMVTSLYLRSDTDEDFGLSDFIIFMTMPLIASLLTGIILWVDSKISFRNRLIDVCINTEDFDEGRNLRKRIFRKIFFVASFFVTPVFITVFLMIMVFFVHGYFDFNFSSVLISIICLEMFGSYFFVLLLSYLFCRFMRKLNYDIKLFSKIYFFVFPVILLMVSLVLYVCRSLTDTYGLIRVVLFTLPVVANLLSLVAAGVISNKIKKKKEVNNSPFADKLGSFGKSFLIASLITSFLNIFVFLFFLNLNYFHVDYLGALLSYFFVTSYMFGILTAFANKVIVHYWKTTKITSVLFTVVYAQVLLGLFYYGILFLEKRAFSSDRYTHRYTHDVNNYPEETGSYDSDTDAPQYDESSAGETETNTEEEKFEPVYLSFLWDFPDDDPQKVKEALREIKSYDSYFSLVRSLYYYNRMNTTEPLSKIVQYVSKNRTDLDYLSLLETYKELVVKIIPKSVYEDRGYNILLKSLNDSYYDLIDYESENKMHKMDSIYNAMSNSEGDYADKFELIEPYISKYFKKQYDYFGNGLDGSSVYPKLVWSYSFWGRRYNEGTVDKTINLIQSVRWLYEDYDEEY